MLVRAQAALKERLSCHKVAMNLSHPVRVSVTGNATNVVTTSVERLREK
jgi:hypothetical protein